MTEHHFVELKAQGVIVVVVRGLRDDAVGRRSVDAFFEFYENTTSTRVLFDLRQAQAATEPGYMMARAVRVAQGLRPSRVAILATDLEDMMSRVYRKASSDAGHETGLFLSLEEAEAWLSTPSEGDELYLA
ncbi:MAG: hypothetical protein ACOC0V_02410 [Oceanicaulis sp.]